MQKWTAIAISCQFFCGEPEEECTNPLPLQEPDSALGRIANTKHPLVFNTLSCCWVLLSYIILAQANCCSVVPKYISFLVVSWAIAKCWFPTGSKMYSSDNKLSDLPSFRIAISSWHKHRAGYGHLPILAGPSPFYSPSPSSKVGKAPLVLFRRVPVM